MIMVRRRLMVLLIAVLVGVFSTGYFIPLPGPGIIAVLARGDGGGGDPGGGGGGGNGDFITMASSALSAYSSDVPTVYQVQPVDTSSWTGYDVTCVCNDAGCTAPTDSSGSACSVAAVAATYNLAAIAPVPSSWGCAAMVGDDGTTDNGPRLQCMSNRLSAQEVLFIPDAVGEYRLDTLSGDDIALQPGSADDQQGVICESRDAVISSNGGYHDVNSFDELRILRTVGDAFPTSGGVAWTGGNSVGSTSITTGTVHGFTAGDAIVFTAARQAPQQDNNQKWATRVASVTGTTTFTIEHAIPDDMNLDPDLDLPGGAFVAQWDPLEEYVVRNCTFENQDPTHVNSGRSVLYHLHGCADCELTNVASRGAYQNHVITEQSADLLIQHSDFTDSHWDKGPNGYGIAFGVTSRVWFHNNSVQHVQAVAIGAQTKAVHITFNAFMAPDPPDCDDLDFNGYCDNDGTTPTYDMDCSLGGSTTCQFTGLALHTSHDPRLETDGYMHCSGDLDDAAGRGGNSGGCNGTRAPGVFGCVEWHNRAGSQGTFMRNYCEVGSVWMDFNYGPGRDNFNFGNWFDDNPERFDIPFGRGRSHFYIVGGGSPPSGYRRNDVWANNIWEGEVQKFDEGGNGVKFLDNVVGLTCQWSGCVDDDPAPDGFCDFDGTTPTFTDPTGGQCTQDNTDLSYPITNSEWLNNTVGQRTHDISYSRTMPSLPGFTDWPDFNGDDTGLTAPFIGPEMGDPDTYGGCLPAERRFNGGSC